MLIVNNLTKKFSSSFWTLPRLMYTAVNNISFEIKQGEILGLLGANGAGKTTTIQMLLGTLTPTSGMITYFGKDFDLHRVEVLRKVGYASGYDRFPPRLTVRENLDVVARIYNIRMPYREQRIAHLLKFFGMWKMRNNQTGTLSAGQTTRVMLAKAFIADPAIVLLDEPTASLDPDVAYEVRKFIMEQRDKQGTSFLITSHNMSEVTELCDRVLVLQSGEIIADNTPTELARSVSNVRLSLIVTNGLEQLFAFVEALRLVHSSHENQVFIEIDEHAIAAFLMNMGAYGVTYSQISIDKPTLEDYFLNITNKKE